MEDSSTEQSTQSINPATAVPGTAPDAHVPRETQGKLPLTGTTTTPSVLRLTACGLVHLFRASPEV